MNKISTFCIYLFLVSTTVRGQTAAQQEHLIPDTSHVVSPTDYEEKLRYIFRDAYSDDSYLQVLVTSSTNPEYVISLHKNKDKFIVIVRSSQQTISDYSRLENFESYQKGVFRKPPITPDSYNALKKKLPADYRHVVVTTKVATIAEGTAMRIVRVWQKALFDVRRSSDGGVSFGGRQLTYSMKSSYYGFISGSSINPESGTSLGSLASLVSSLRDLPAHPDKTGSLESKVIECEKIFDIGK